MAGPTLLSAHNPYIGDGDLFIIFLYEALEARPAFRNLAPHI